MVKISIGEEIRDKIPHFKAATLQAKTQNTPLNEELWDEIHEEITRVKNSYTLENVREQPQIHATREAYKTLGKDPNRYRPSADGLMRRVVKGNDLYQINTLVDIINLVALKKGYSIGGFDASKIQGNPELGVGKTGEQYEGIGRGQLNIENMPVYRDDIGGIGTPTSDHVRTAIMDNTSKLLIIINSYSGDKKDLIETSGMFELLLKKYAKAREININYYPNY
jgi:DNA/RNA-binding domain of Phe-tRNA-synthetase-like protein